MPLSEPFRTHLKPLSRADVRFGLATRSYEETVQPFWAQRSRRRSPRARQVLRAPAEDGVGYAAEALPGVVLMHAQVPGLRTSKVLLGLHPEGCDHPAAPGPVHGVAVLDPAWMPASKSLARLANLAHYFAHEPALEALSDVRDRAELERWFAEARLTSV